MDSRPLDRWWSWLLLPATVALLVSALTLSHHGWTGVSEHEGVILTVEPGGPGERAGLASGDRVRSLTADAHPDPLAPGPLEMASPGAPLVLVRERAGRASTVWLLPEPLRTAERRLRALDLLVAAGFLLLAGWVWSERRDRLTRVFLVLGIAFAGMLAPQPWLAARAARITYDLLFLAAQLLVAPLFLHFFALFPQSTARPSARVWVRAAYGAAAALLLAQFAIVAEARFGAGALGALRPALADVTSVFFTLCVAGGLVLFALSFARAGDPDSRRRLRVAFFGTLLGIGPLALLVVWHALSPGLSLPGERWAIAGTLLMPASFAWAIAVHRVFDFRIALRAAVTVLVAVLFALVVYAGGEWLAADWRPAFGAGIEGVSLALLVLLAALAGTLRPWLGALGARVVPIPDEVSLASWSPSATAAAADDSGPLLGEACAAVARALRLDGCAALRRVNGSGVALAAHAGARLLPALGPGFLEALARQRSPAATSDIEFASEDRDTLELAGVHWLLLVPGAPAPAALLLGRRLAGAWLDRHEALELQRFALHLATALENVELRREARAHGVLARELVEAHRVQVRRLPRRAPVYPTLDCAAAALSLESVGGDYYDFVEGGPRDVTLAVGDAAGHGVPAAIVLAGVQSRFRDEAQRARHPAELLEALNRDLVALEQPEKFMGLLCARIDVHAGILRFANAGLTPPLIRRADGRFEVASESGVLLGVSESARYPLGVVELDAGDIAVVHTDGLSEASRGGEQFGAEGVRRVLDAHAHRRAADILEELFQAVRAWADEPLDDVTVVVLKQLTRPSGGRARVVRPGLKLGIETADTVG